MNNTKLVMLCGAGFPLMWGAPTSKVLTNKIKEIIRAKLGNKKKQCKKLVRNDSFENILAAIESLMSYRLAKKNRNYLSSFFKCTNEKINIDSLWNLYKLCINKIIDEVAKYESATLNDKKRKESIISFWQVLSNNFGSVNYYTTNYDEILPYVIEVGDTQFAVIQSNKKNTFFNLHGSIHLSMEKNGYGYYICHNEKACDLNRALLNKGGNPNEPLIFSPIITGRNKSQRLMDEYFNRGVVSFANDLRECTALLIVGYSFSDPHINMLIKEFTEFGKTKVIVIDYLKDKSAYDSNLFERIIRIIPLKSKYKKDGPCDEWLTCNNSYVNMYKGGSEKLFSDPKVIDKILKICSTHQSEVL